MFEEKSKLGQWLACVDYLDTLEMSVNVLTMREMLILFAATLLLK